MDKADLITYLYQVVDNLLISYHQENGLLPRKLEILDLDVLVDYIETYQKKKIEKLEI